MKANCPASLVVALLAGLSLAAGCSRAIGDDCKTSVDCDPNGTRSCDLSQPGGYCTITGCSEKSCPSEASCIRSFPVQYLSKPCNASCEDVSCRLGACPDPDPSKCLPACEDLQPKCVGGTTDDCTPDEICLNVGLCAARSLEQRYCAKDCGGNGDCRDGYECRISESPGIMALSATPYAATHICVPRAP